MNILALDIGKYNTVFCDYNSDNGEHEFGKVKTTPKEIHDLIVEKEPQRIVLEVCHIAGWVIDIARALGKETETANTTHDAWRWKNVKKKNDREDALKLAKLSAMNQLPTVHIPTKQVREKRALIKYRQRLVKHRKSIKNAIRAIFSREGITTVPRGKNAWSKDGLRWLRTHAKPLEEIADIDRLWRGQLHVELETFEAISESLKKVEDKLNKLGACDGEEHQWRFTDETVAQHRTNDACDSTIYPEPDRENNLKRCGRPEADNRGRIGGRTHSTKRCRKSYQKGKKSC
ncbi:MAG: IS110 family transposase [Planctomycetota bacterium]|jgi:hypothetical protein